MNLLENNRISSAPNSLSLSKEFSWTFFLLSPRSLSLALLPSPFFLSKILSKPLNNRKRFAARTIVPHSFIWLHYLYNLIETASYPTTIEVVLFGRIAINFQSCLIPIWQISSKCIKSCFFSVEICIENRLLRSCIWKYPSLWKPNVYTNRSFCLIVNIKCHMT